MKYYCLVVLRTEYFMLVINSANRKNTKILVKLGSTIKNTGLGQYKKPRRVL